MFISRGWEHFGEHLRGMEEKSPGFPIAEPFNGLQHTLPFTEIHSIKLCTGNNINPKRKDRRNEADLLSWELHNIQACTPITAHRAYFFNHSCFVSQVGCCDTQFQSWDARMK